MKFNREDFVKRKVVAGKNETLITPKGFKYSLIPAGITKHIFSIPDFILEKSISSFTSEVDGLKPKMISKQKQVDSFKKVYDKPLQSPYIYCISGRPNDLKAKLLAAFIMHKASNDLAALSIDEKTKRKMHLKSKPVFHSMMGWSKNTLLEYNNSPALLVISNVPKGMTDYKKEKLRDVLEKYSDTPRIVVTAGHDPLTFFNSELFLSVNYVCYLSDSIVKKSHEI